MVSKADVVGLGNAYAALDSAIGSGDVPGIISGVAGIIAGLPGPQQTGTAIAATGLSAMTAGAHASNGNLTPSDVAGVASGILGILAAGFVFLSYFRFIWIYFRVFLANKTYSSR